MKDNIIPINTKDVNLNKEQREAIASLDKWYYSPRKIGIFSGSAGTGKTYTVGYWIQKLSNPKAWPEWVTSAYEKWLSSNNKIYIKHSKKEWGDDTTDDWQKWLHTWETKQGNLDNSRSLKVAFLTPTHKARKILEKSLESSGIVSPSTFTIAQALGQQPVLNTQGREEFVSKKDSILFDYDLVVVDESSMVNKEDYDSLCSESKKILFIGDKYQVPPVNDDYMPFAIATPDYELTRIMRYSGHLLSECTKLREGVRDGVMSSIVCDGVDIVSIGKKDAISKAVKLIRSEQYKGDPTYVKLLAFRNKVVDVINLYIKRIVHQRYDSYFKGLRLVASGPVQRQVDNNEWSVICNNSDELLIKEDAAVVDIKEIYGNFLISNGLRNILDTYLKGKVSVFKCLGEDYNVFEAFVLDSNVEQQKKDLIKKIRQEYRLQPKQQLKYYLSFLYRFGDNLKDVFCSTVHKSQGSTYSNVFIEYQDIITAPKSGLDQRPALLYTAVSRASEKVYIINN